MRTQYKMRSKLVASVAAAAMAASMVVAVPGAAFATYDTGSISAKTTTAVNTTVGSQVDMADYFTYSASGGDGAWHVDYKVTDGSAATVNKHSGVLTPTAEGSVVVTAYLTGIETPTKNPSNPCEETEISASVTVDVATTTTYGFQGANVAIKMTNPTPAYYSGNNEDGWKNALSGATASDGYYYFNMEMNNGFKKYNTAALFAKRNAGNITLNTADGTNVAKLTSLNAGKIKITAVDSDSKTFTVAVSADAVASGANVLQFESGFLGNNDSNTLGTTVAFTIA